MMRLTSVLVAALLVATCGNNEARTTEDGSKQKFLWKTGGWGSCYAVGGCGEGRRERLVWCSEADGRTVLEVMCDSQGEPPTSKPCFTACRHHRDKLQWQVGAWGPCLPVSPADVNVADLQQPFVGDARHNNLGVTQRNVSCVLVSHDAVKVHRPVDEENCFTVARKPDPVRFCHIPRPQDCVVGPFGEWSACKGCPAANQTRVRAVLVAPLNGGKPCPELTETRVCNPRAECLMHSSSSSAEDGSRAPSPEYKLKLGEWRRCEAPTSVVSADLIEARLNTPGGRDALYIPGSSITNNNNNNVFPVSPVLGGTSTESAENYYTFQPQVGYQTREVSCRDSRGAIVDISLCLNEDDHRSEMPPHVRPCVVAQDCIVSQWSAWIRTQDGCVAASGKIRPEIHERKREVVRLQEGNGQVCPHLVETRHTTDRDQLQLCANKYRWLASKWSPCVVTSDDPTMGPRLVEVRCGGGVQLRDVTCVQASQSSQPVSDELCESLEPLPTVQRCEVACPRDCEVGQWEPWGPCMPLECPLFGDPPSKGYRERRRNIEVMASSQGLACPSTREVQPCPQPECHSWVEGHWSSCELDPGNKKCGEGRRTREVTCRSIYGGVVEDAFCERRQPKPMTIEPCLLPCPFDCVLSPWSEWSPCSHSCSSPRQIAMRQRNRTVIAPPGSGGHGCPPPDEMMQMEPCNTHSCHGYSWLALPWQECHPIKHSVDGFNATTAPTRTTTIDADMDDYTSSSSDGGNCGAGMQEREVWCMEAHAKQVADSNCHPLQRPVSSRECWQTCPVDCLVSPWSEWSSCPQQCVPDASSEVREGEVAPTQSRHRVVLRWPSGGGSQCPVLEELRPCPLSGARCRHYLWGEGPWSDCQLPATVECGMGYRTRAVWCYKNHRSVKVEPSLCLERSNGTAPSQSEPCFVDCQWPCVLSQWTEWTICTQACSTRTRARQLIGLSGSRNPCKDTELFPLRETEPCACARYTMQPTGPWSDCILEGDGVSTSIAANGRIAHGICGAGSRFRRTECVDGDSNLVEPSLCGGELGLEEEPCLIPCPSDCRLSEWTAWGECSAICGPGLHNRTRQVIHPSVSGGRPCGSLVEHKVCSQPCESFHWVAGGWSDCQLIAADRNTGCGTGDQYRRIRCMHVDEGTGLPTEVADVFCDPVTQPPDLNACHVACPGDCVLGPWSDWSDCPQPCDSSRERQRTRSVLRSPANSHDGHSNSMMQLNCPPLIEAQACHLNSTCFSYSWRHTELGSCLPLGGSPCGEGVQSRAVFCERSDGRPVVDKYCEATGEGRPAASEKWCYVDCPVDCEVTQWSSWNQSTCRCGLSGDVMVRERHIVTQPSEKGRPCPHELLQHKPCPALPCYTWHRGNWGTCDLQGAWCGHGIMGRNVTCLRGGTTTVEPNLCQASESYAVDLKKQERCYAPCRGDCRVSEWSHWSHCHRNCQAADVGGYQTRSRAVLKAPTPGGEPCPTALWETRPCFTGACLTFNWVMVEDGQITCQRSDGVIVIGGCDGKPKPCTGDDCMDVAHARCDTQQGVCLCKPGYEPQYDGHRLILCTLDGQTTLDDRATQHKPGTSATDIPLLHQATASEDEIQSRYYYPKDDDINVWMFAMIGIGCVFIVFVAVSIYLMCHGSWRIMGYHRSMQPTIQQSQQPQQEASKEETLAKP